MRLIDVDAFKFNLENSCSSEMETCAFINYLSYLDDQPTIKIRDWIPVSEKLPNSNGRFEVTVKGSKGKRHVEMCNFNKDATLDSNKWGGKWEQVNVIAWRERDEPYK